ncbi:hypothetical protein Patl1_10592 [Pistacia atlantica]|uniref:Uncharacterized protein n=1 Tax=Pistacia atlantica TaxID=434234 RepID=A0ACC1A484_9ROSI|nr:hypothetical protein Patl1_10592 [Pistacia atlantica]
MGKLNDLEKKRFVATTECSTDERNTIKPENLTLHSFWGLYVVYGAISVICFMLFIIRLVNNFRCRQGMYNDNTTPSNRGVWETVINLAKYFNSGKETNYTPERAPDFAQAQDAVSLCKFHITECAMDHKLLISSFIILCRRVELEAADGYKLINIGAIIDNANSRIKKEQRVAMQIAVRNSNTVLKNYNLSLHCRHPDRDLLKVVTAGLIADKRTASQEPPITTPLMETRWPFLKNMYKKSWRNYFKHNLGFLSCFSHHSPMTIHLFREAKKMGLVGTDSVWIITETITSLLDSFNTSVISSMEGAVGIKTYFSEDTTSHKYFKAQFKTKFRSENPEEDRSDPGIYTLKAYDSIKIVAPGPG